MLCAPGAATRATPVGRGVPAERRSSPWTPRSSRPPRRTASTRCPRHGVITSWSFQAGPTPPTLKLKVGRAASGAALRSSGRARSRCRAANQVNTFTNVRIPVAAGDMLGFYLPTQPADARPAAATVRLPRRRRGSADRAPRRRTAGRSRHSSSTSPRCSSPTATTTASATRPRTCARRRLEAGRLRRRRTPRSPRAPKDKTKKKQRDVRVHGHRRQGRRGLRVLARRRRLRRLHLAAHRQGQEGQAHLLGRARPTRRATSTARPRPTTGRSSEEEEALAGRAHGFLQPPRAGFATLAAR